MARLSRSDLEAVLDFAGGVAAAARTAERADVALLEHIVRMLRADGIAYCHFDSSHRMLEDTELPDEPIEPSEELWEALRSDDNPYSSYAQRARQPHFAATRLFDIVDRKSLERTTLYQLTPNGGDPSAQMRMRGENGSVWLLEVVRHEREFTDRELLLLDSIRPWLEMYEDRRVLLRQIAAVRVAPIDERRASRLTERENQVLDRVADGASNQDVADALHISPETVRKHLENTYAKLEVTSRTAALARTGRTSLSHPEILT